MIHIVNFSGGKDSTAMLLKMLENGVKVDYILFADTGVEYPEIIDNVLKVDKYLQEHYGLQITFVKGRYDFIYYVTEYKRVRGKRKGLPYGFPSWRNRWCTAELKRRPINNFLKRFKDERIVNFIGYAKGEERRYEALKKRENKFIKYYAPLIEDFNFTEEDALRYCYSKGFTFSGIYGYLKRASCYLCPFQGIEGFRYVYEKHPELWKQIKNIENSLKKKGVKEFRVSMDMSSEDLENLFKQKNFRKKEVIKNEKS